MYIYILGGTLLTLIKERIDSLSPFTENEILDMMDQIIFAIKYLHTKKIVHRDIKPENIFLDSDKNIKLGDFGLSSILSTGKWTVTSTGSVNYAAPEIFEGKETKLEPDLWALGCLIYELATLEKCFQGNNMLNTITKVQSGKYDEGKLAAVCSSALCLLVRCLLNVNMNQRPNIHQVSSNYIYIYILAIFGVISNEADADITKLLADMGINGPGKVNIQNIPQGEKEVVEELKNEDETLPGMKFVTPNKPTEIVSTIKAKITNNSNKIEDNLEKVEEVPSRFGYEEAEILNNREIYENRPKKSDPNYHGKHMNWKDKSQFGDHNKEVSNVIYMKYSLYLFRIQYLWWSWRFQKKNI